MAEKGYSAFGIDPRRVREVVRPLAQQMGRLEGTTINGRREKFIYFQLVDAYLAAEALVLLTIAGLEGRPVGMGGIEVIARRLIEQAIVVRYVGGAADSAVIDRYLKTSAHKWEFSWETGEGADDRDLPVTLLPPYKNMALEIAEPELAAVFAKLSYLSHPQGALPYSMRVDESTLEAASYFQINLARTLVWVDIAIRHILVPYREDPGPLRP